MRAFLSIPTFRSMKYLHGVLGYLAVAALVSWLVPLYMFQPGHPEIIAMFQWANFLACLTFSPLFVWAYGSTSSNQY